MAEDITTIEMRQIGMCLIVRKDVPLKVKEKGKELMEQRLRDEGVISPIEYAEEYHPTFAVCFDGELLENDVPHYHISAYGDAPALEAVTGWAN